jgi:hypothetical protein
MANNNAPAGLSPVGYLNGAPWNGQGRRYYIPASDTNAYSIGDPVTLTGDGDASGVAGVVLATPGSGIVGVVLGAGGERYGGMSADPDNLNTTIVPATKTKPYYVMVCDDPNVLFEVQEIGTGTALTAAAIGLNCNLVAGTNSGYLSGWLLDNTTEATTSTLDVKLLGLRQITNNVFGAYAKWVVKINNHNYAAGVTGV